MYRPVVSVELWALVNAVTIVKQFIQLVVLYSTQSMFDLHQHSIILIAESSKIGNYCVNIILHYDRFKSTLPNDRMFVHRALNR